MDVLPNADKAIIQDDKLYNYSLNFEREPNKAQAFKDAFGYDLSNAEELKSNILNNADKFKAVEKPGPKKVKER